MRYIYIFLPVFFFRSKKKTIIYLSSFSSSTIVFRTPQCNQSERSHTSVLLLYLISVVSFVFIRFFGCKRRRDDFFNGSILSLASTPPLFPFAPLFSLPLPPPPPDTMNDNERSQCPTPSLSLSLSPFLSVVDDDDRTFFHFALFLSTSTTHRKKSTKSLTPWPAPSSAATPQSRRTRACRGPCPRRSRASRAPRRGSPV